MNSYFNLSLVSITFFSLSSLLAMETDKALRAATTSTDLEASSMFTPGMFQQPEIDSMNSLYSQSGISISPAQWHLLLPETVKTLCNAVSENTKEKKLLDRLNLVAMVIADMQQAKPAYHEKQNQQAILSRFFEVCLPGSEVRSLDKKSVEKIEATKSMPLLKYIFDVLKKEQDKTPLPISSRGHIIQLQKRIEVLEKNGDYTVGEQSPVKKTVSGNSSPQTIFAAASSVLGASPVSSPTAPSALDQLPSFDPADSVLIGQQVQGAVNVYGLFGQNVRDLTDQIAALDKIIAATDTVLNVPEIDDIPFTQRVLQEVRDERKAQLMKALVEREGYEQDQNSTLERVAEAHKELSGRREEREKALEKVEEQTKLVTQQLATLNGFIQRATQLKAAHEEQLAQLKTRREAIEKAQERVRPGIEVAEELCKKDA